MKRFVLPLILVVGIAVCGVLAADPKPLGEVDMDALTEETQVDGGGDGELNFVWWIPQEFWLASLANNNDISEDAARRAMASLSDYCIIGVVRAHIGEGGEFDFVDEPTVLEKLTVWHFDADGDRTILRLSEAVNDDAAELLATLRPSLAAAMGPMGESFHLFVFEDVDADGHRIISPYEKGEIGVALMSVGELSTVKLTINTPLDSLHAPRVCAPCEKSMHLSWNFCPFCGVELDK